MIKFAPIIAPIAVTFQQHTPVDEVKIAPPAQDVVVTAPPDNIIPPFVLEATASGRPRPIRLRNKHIGPPQVERAAAREEIQLSLGLDELKSLADPGVCDETA